MLCKLYGRGYYIIIWICCSGKNLFDVINWLLEYNIFFDRVNDYCLENIKWYGKGFGKIYVNIYIDDKNFGGFFGWFCCLEEIEWMEFVEND